MEQSKWKIYLQPPKGPKHDRSKQGKKGEFARLSSVLSQPSGSQGQAEREGARATRAKVSKPAPKRLVKPCASPLHSRETPSTPAETGWTQRTVRDELQGNDAALAVLDVMESFDKPFSQDNPFSRGICRAESDRAFSSSGQFAPGQ